VTTSLTITAQYAIKTYDITTSVTGGTITPSQVVNHGSDCTITYGEDTGYHLVSVTVDGEAKDIVANAGSYTFEDVTDDHTIDVVYEIDTFAITTSVTGGTITPDQTVNYNDDCEISYAPQGPGYHLVRVTVDGEDKDIATFANSYTFEDVKAPHTIDVEYEYRFVVKANASMVNGGIDVTYAGETRTLAPGASTTFKEVDGFDEVWFQGAPNAGYHFLKWHSSANPEFDNNGLRSRSIFIAQTFTPYADFEVTVYNIVYDELGGGANDPGNPLTYTVEDAEITLADATWDGYTFLGWAEGNTIPAGSTGAKTFTAQWSDPIVYNITYELGGGDNAPGNPLTYTVEDAEITLSDATRDGYTFLGWAEGNTIPAGSTGAKTFTAQWSDAIVYDIAYDLAGGSVDGTNPVTYTVESDDITLINPELTGYTFTGWTGTGITDGTDTVVIPKGSIGHRSFTATYAINTFTVTFLDYDGVELGTDVVAYGGDAAAPADPTRTGYTFTGWNASLEGITEDVTVTAEYLLNTYTVTFVDYDGTEIDEQTIDWNEAADAPDDPAREGHTFAGWDTDFDAVTRNLTVTATYTINTFTVEFVDFDGTVLDTQTVDWNTAATAPDDPERDGYEFTGWDIDFDAVTENLTVRATYEEVTVLDEEPIPGTDDTTTLNDEGVPAAGGGGFPWWWIPIIGAAALALFLILFFWKRRKKDEEETV
jgi:uncharacterized repeat protein (TIGR02543 family)/LPXTG-motif cell wall-anchored protein